MNLSDYDVQVLQQRVSAREAQAVLHHYRMPGGVEPGSFVQSLVETIARADPVNRLRLGIGFLGYVSAVYLAELTPDGIEWLRRRAGEP